MARILLITACLVVGVSPAQAYPRPGLVERVSQTTDSTPANGSSQTPSISGDGRFVAFSSGGSNLVAGDTNDMWDVFVHDRATGAIERVSVASDGTEGNGSPSAPGISSSAPAISANGRWVAFFGHASNLVADDTNEVADVFVHDRSTGATERVSVTGDGTQGNDRVWGAPHISGDGRYVAFTSFASNLVPGDTNGLMDTFVHDRASGTTERVSVASDGTQSNGSAWSPVLSADGSRVAFYSTASTLVADDNGDDGEDVFLHDRLTGATEQISVASDGTPGNHPIGINNSWRPAISADGRLIAFVSSASNLVPADRNAKWDIFVRDTGSDTTERVSVASDGTESDGNATNAAISADGRLVGFTSPATDLVEGGTTAMFDIFVHDRAAGTTELVSSRDGATQADNHSFGLVIGADGRFVAFDSAASNLVAGDASGTRDVFVRDRGGPLGIVGGLELEETSGAWRVSGTATFSGATMSRAADDSGDGASIGPVTADELGAELTGAVMTYRPEPEDLLLRWRVASLPFSDSPVAPTHQGGLAGIVYGLEFTVQGTRFEVRGMRAAVSTMPPSAPHIALYRCAPECVQEAALSGGFGSTGEEVRVSLPLEALDVGHGDALSDLRAYTAVGEATTGSVQPVDDIDLGAVVVPEPRVELGLGPALAPEGQIAFGASAAPAEGRFVGNIAKEPVAPGDYRLWARSCLGDVCGPGTSVEVSR